MYIYCPQAGTAAEAKRLPGIPTEGGAAKPGGRMRQALRSACLIALHVEAPRFLVPDKCHMFAVASHLCAAYTSIYLRSCRCVHLCSVCGDVLCPLLAGALSPFLAAVGVAVALIVLALVLSMFLRALDCALHPAECKGVRCHWVSEWGGDSCCAWICFQTFCSGWL